MVSSLRCRCGEEDADSLFNFYMQMVRWNMLQLHIHLPKY